MARIAVVIEDDLLIEVLQIAHRANISCTLTMPSASRSTSARVLYSAKEAREEIRNAIGFSAADELKKLDELKASGSITADEYTKLRARIV